MLFSVETSQFHGDIHLFRPVKAPEQQLSHKSASMLEANALLAAGSEVICGGHVARFRDEESELKIRQP
jgi:hypothetical protein